MEDKYQLISHKTCPFVQRAAIAFLEKDIPFTRTDIDLSDKPDWFLTISPLGKVPVLKVGDDVVFESSVIAEYVNEIGGGDLLPSEPLAKAKQRAWIEYASNACMQIFYFLTTNDEEVYKEKSVQIENICKRLEAELDEEGPYFTGKTFQLVDAAWAPVFRYLKFCSTLPELAFLQKNSKCLAFGEALMNRKSVQQAVPEDFEELQLQRLKEQGGLAAGKL